MICLALPAAVAAEPTAPVNPAADGMQQLATAAFNDRCARCHASGALTPLPAQLRKLTPEDIYSALRHGVMQEYVVGMDDGVLHALADMLGDARAAQTRPPHGGATMCEAETPAAPAAAAWSGWSADVTQMRHVADVDGARTGTPPRLAWAFVFPDTQAFKGAGNPVTVADGRVYVGNLNRWVYALDAARGCAYWSFQADGRVRSNVAVADGVAVFGDLLANVYGVDAATGRLLWRARADQQSTTRITGSLTVHGGRVYVPVAALQEGLGMHPDLSCCTFKGSVVAYDLRTGTRAWRTVLIDEPLRHLGTTARGVNRYGPSGVAVFVAPTIDIKRGLLYIGTGNQHTEPLIPESDAVIALDLASGAKRWVANFAPAQFAAQDIYHIGCEAWMDPKRETCSPENPRGTGDRDFAAPVMLVTRSDGKNVLVAGSKDGMLYALDPDRDGARLWELRVGRGGELGGIEYGLATDGETVYAPVVDWNVGEPADGALNAVDLNSGRLRWRTPTPGDGCQGKGESCNNGLASPATVLGEWVIVGGLDGVLRGYERTSGRILWSYDAVRRYDGVNGLTGEGGSFGMGGATIVGRQLFITSGLQLFNAALGGNVLLAFELGAADTP